MITAGLQRMPFQAICFFQLRYSLCIPCARKQENSKTYPCVLLCASPFVTSSAILHMLSDIGSFVLSSLFIKGALPA